MSWEPTDLIAAYAAVVASAALLLELRRWFESGPKPYLSASADMRFAGQGDGVRDRFIMVQVANRGDLATTITHLVLQRYTTPLARWRNRPRETSIVPLPTLGREQQLPFTLEPGRRWVGMALQDEAIQAVLDRGELWVEIYASHRERPLRTKVLRPKRPPFTARP